MRVIALHLWKTVRLASLCEGQAVNKDAVNLLEVEHIFWRPGSSVGIAALPHLAE